MALLHLFIYLTIQRWAFFIEQKQQQAAALPAAARGGRGSGTFRLHGVSSFHKAVGSLTFKYFKITVEEYNSQRHAASVWGSLRDCECSGCFMNWCFLPLNLSLSFVGLNASRLAYWQHQCGYSWQVGLFAREVSVLFHKHETIANKSKLQSRLQAVCSIFAIISVFCHCCPSPHVAIEVRECPSLTRVIWNIACLWC